MLFGERLKSLRKSKTLTQVDLASVLELDKSSIAKYETLKAIPSLEILMKLAKYFNVSVDYMLGNETPSYLPQNENAVKIPVYNKINSLPVKSNWDISGYEEISAEITGAERYFAMRVNDSSMEPRIWKGDLVIAEEDAEVKNGDFVIALIPGAGAVCRKYISQPLAGLISLNPAFEPLFFSEEAPDKSFKVFGRITEVRAEL